MSSFVAGGYTVTYNNLALGQAAQGYRLSHQFFKRLITGDSMAEAPQDAVYRGAEMFLAANLIEYLAAGIATAIWPYGAYLTQGVVGRLDDQSTLIKQIVMTAVATTPAAAALGPASLTLPKCILAEGFPVELLMAPDLKEVPVRWRIYPNSSGVFGTQT
jgi:hypothetical protein